MPKIHAGRAGRFTSPAAQAKINGPFHFFTRFNVSVHESLHKRDSASRGVHLIFTGFDIRWTAWEAKAAARTIQDFLIVHFFLKIILNPLFFLCVHHLSITTLLVKIFSGFMMLFGSSACLILRIASIPASPAFKCKYGSFIAPTPCSP